MKAVTRTLSLLSLTMATLGAPARAQGPQYTPGGELIRPAGYREWVFLSSGLGMTYGPAAAGNRTPRFDNVFVHPDAYRSFLSTGKWPDKTMLVLEVRRASSEGSINKGGHFQSEIVSVEVEVKDESRFPDKWAFFGFDATAKTGKPFARDKCLSCHSKHGAVDNTFVQFYPTLIDVAKAKGTFKAPVASAAIVGHN
jgi:hypothetical protein